MSENLTKQLLIAMPSMADPNFSQTVTLICEHTQQGAMGIVVNQPTTIFVEELLSDFLTDEEETDKNNSAKEHYSLITHEPVFSGGPVHIDRGFILHDSDQQWQSTHMIDNNLHLTTSEDILIAIAQGKGPQNSLIALGYAGWSAGQLEQELSDNAWLTVPYEADIIFNVPIEKRWQSAANKIGIDLHLISNQTGHA